MSSTGALELPNVPQKLLVVGAGIIGLELGSVWRRLGAQVTVVEFLDHILPGIDGEVARQFQRLLQKQGIAFKLSSKVTGGRHLRQGTEGQSRAAPDGGGGGDASKRDVVLVAIGRVPFTDGLGLEAVGVKKDNRGRIIVDPHFRTNVPGIYAIGDVIAGPMLAHKAEDEGVAAAEIIAGQAGHVNYDVIPNVVYTYPEIAVGRQDRGRAESGRRRLSGRQVPVHRQRPRPANLATDGFVKILADAKTDRVLGVHILGPDAETMIAEAAIAMEFGASSEDIARTCHAHPTLSRGGEGSGAGRRQARDQFLISAICDYLGDDDHTPALARHCRWRGPDRTDARLPSRPLRHRRSRRRAQSADRAGAARGFD